MFKQAKKVYDFTLERLQTVQRNYVSQRSRVRKFSAHQLIRLREKYKFQQKTLNKILENLPAFYIDSCRSATCARTDSMYFEDETEVDMVESIIKQGIALGLPLGEALGEESDGGGQEEGPKKSSAHGRQSSAGSLDFSFLFPPIRFPSRLNWRRRNTVDEEQQDNEHEEETNNVNVKEEGNSSSSVVEVSVEICPHRADILDPLPEDSDDVVVGDEPAEEEAPKSEAN